jgi:two-component system sensor histidine kinase QseC
MKLLDKYNRLNITATILVFVAGSCLFYFLLNYILISQLDETLQSEKQEITAYVAAHNALPEIISTKDQHATYTLTAKPTGTRFTFIHNKHQPAEDLRQIQFGISVANKYYIIKVDKPLEGTESLLQIIIIVTVAMIALILLISYVVNRMVIRKLWQPFYRTIDTVSCYHLSDQSQAIPADTGIEEFTLLNNSISQMIIRIQQDYSALKDFTGHAAQ